MTSIPETSPASGEVLFIPLSRLKKSPKNVRKVPHAKADIEQLAASIVANGLLQNLVVEPERDAERPTGNYLVTIGEGRRLAYRLLAKTKLVDKDAPVRCVLDTWHNAREISLAENVVRTSMHPADQYEAFAKLHNGDGMSAADIAGRFGVPEQLVTQRLKLGAVSPKLIKRYRAGELTLDQLTAFAITDDHAAQERVWAALKSFGRSRHAILEALSEGQVPSDDRRAAFVGAEAYEAAGGTIIRDLFDEDGGGFFTDAELLNRLAYEKLQDEADRVAAEGWKWVELTPEFDYGRTGRLRRIYPEAPPLSGDQQARLDALEAEYNALCDAEGELTDANAAVFQRLDAEIAALTGEEQYDPAEIARAGAFVSLGYDGSVRIERGFIRPGDEAETRADDDGHPGAMAGKADGVAPLSDKLVGELTSYRTAGLRNALAGNPDTALTAVVHALAADAFFPHEQLSCLRISVRSAALSAQAPGIAESEAERQMEARHDAWARRMPEASHALWDFIAALSESERGELLAHCAARAVDAIQSRSMRAGAGVLAHADQLARAVALDMTAYWQPTAENYLARVSKERILEAVREGVSPQAADNIAAMKKQAMAETAEKRLAGKGWLPALLRTRCEPGTAPAELPAAAE